LRFRFLSFFDSREREKRGQNRYDADGDRCDDYHPGDSTIIGRIFLHRRWEENAISKQSAVERRIDDNKLAIRAFFDENSRHEFNGSVQLHP
jgi:hypothetical protein